MASVVNALKVALQGPQQARAMHRSALSRGAGIADAMRVLERICPGDPANDPEAPIFLLSAGWRSGSTLLQRLVMSGSGVLIWGEPYDECGLVQSLAQAMRPFRDGWPPPDYLYDGRPTTELTGEWIANLFPSLTAWRSGQRALFDAMYAKPARQAGVMHWGIKEVRLTVEHCHYLRWIYPNSRFVFLLRHPLDAYRSYVRYGRSWYDTFPDRPVFTPSAFGQHWGRVAEGFKRDADILNALIVKYEELATGSFDLSQLEQHLGLILDRRVLTRKIAGTTEGSETPVNSLERWLLKRAVGQTASSFGYTW